MYREGNRETHRELQCHPQLYFEKPFKMLNKNNLSSDFTYNIHMTLALLPIYFAFWANKTHFVWKTITSLKKRFFPGKHDLQVKSGVNLMTSSCIKVIHTKSFFYCCYRTDNFSIILKLHNKNSQWIITNAYSLWLIGLEYSCL